MPDAKRQRLESYIHSWLGNTLDREQGSPLRGRTAQKQTQALDDDDDDDNDSNKQPRRKRKRERERSDKQEEGERQSRGHGRDSVLFDEEGSLGSGLNNKDKRDGKRSRGFDNSEDGVGRNHRIIIAPSTMTDNHPSLDVDMADDATTTPRSRHNKRRREQQADMMTPTSTRTTWTMLPRPERTMSASASASASVSSDTSSLHSHSSRHSGASSRRSNSPSKMSHFNSFAPGGFVYEPGLVIAQASQRPGGHDLQSILPLLQRIEGIAMGMEPFVSHAEKAMLQTDKRSSYYFRPDAFFLQPGTGTGHLDPVPDQEQQHSDQHHGEANLDVMWRLCQKTLRCRQKQDSEYGWNCAVHYPIMDLALESSAHQGKLGLSNICTARIQPPSLLETGPTTLPTRLVDFAYVLEPSQAMQQGLRNVEHPVGPNAHKSLNPTYFNAIIDSPIAISVETKTDGDSKTQSLNQLTTWVWAHMNRLRLLVEQSNRNTARRPDPIPPLPLLLAQGAVWTLLVATTNPEADRKVLWEICALGDSSTILGIYRIVAALRLLLDWAEKDYRPWFEQYALPLTAQERASTLPLTSI